MTTPPIHKQVVFREIKEGGEVVAEFVDRGGKPIRLWTCDHCGKRGSWGPTWAWNGSLRDHENQTWSRITVVCSMKCYAAVCGT